MKSGQNERVSRSWSTLLCFVRRRWMLTGTPLQNDVSDAFALAKFLKLLPAGTTAWWNANVAQPMERGALLSGD